MAVYEIWPVFMAFFFLAMPVEFVRSQHPGCREKQPADGGTVECAEGGYTLPTNFNTTALADWDFLIGLLRIAGYDNMGLADLEPLPYLWLLRTVELHNFNEHMDLAFPLSRFLAKNKRIAKLELVNVKLIRLTSADFEGITYLTQVSLHGCSLTSIATDTFGGLGLLPWGLMTPNYTSYLEFLRISSNPQLTGLDWSFLAPVSKSLNVCNLRGNGVQSDKLIKSRDFRLSAAAKIFLQDNKLTSLPLSVMETFPETVTATFSASFTGNPICHNNPENDCSCCELAEFGEWAHKNAQKNFSFGFNCGQRKSTPGDIFSLSLFRDTDMHKHCKKTQPTLEPATEPAPTPTPWPEKSVEKTVQPVNSAGTKRVDYRRVLGRVNLTQPAVIGFYFLLLLGFGL